MLINTHVNLNQAVPVALCFTVAVFFKGYSAQTRSQRSSKVQTDYEKLGVFCFAGTLFMLEGSHPFWGCFEKLNFHLLKSMLCFPLLGLEGIYHHWTYVWFFQGPDPQFVVWIGLGFEPLPFVPETTKPNQQWEATAKRRGASKRQARPSAAPELPRAASSAAPAAAAARRLAEFEAQQPANRRRSGWGGGGGRGRWGGGGEGGWVGWEVGLVGWWGWLGGGVGWEVGFVGEGGVCWGRWWKEGGGGDGRGVPRRLADLAAKNPKNPRPSSWLPECPSYGRAH